MKKKKIKQHILITLKKMNSMIPKIDIDNNRDIDLTNDYKQSAIGLSALVKIPEKLKISINDMGVYHNLKNDIKNELLTICLFVSKFAKDAKSYVWFKENYSLIKVQRTSTLQFLEKLFNIKESRIKNIEDYYDKFFSFRKGWHQKIELIQYMIKCIYSTGQKILMSFL